MNTVSMPAVSPTFPIAGRANVVLQDKVSIPGWISDLTSYRRWAHSDTFPETGWISYLNGEIWVDLEMEFLTHNQVKMAYTGTLYVVLQQAPLGRLVPGRMLLTNLAANLSTEPDLLFFYWNTMQSGRIRLVPGSGNDGSWELEGTPEMVLEIVSKTSERKDTKVLRDLYWRAGIQEYWLVDVRTGAFTFEILRHGSAGYEAVAAAAGWLYSTVFERSFQLDRQTDPLGHPLFVVNVK